MFEYECQVLSKKFVADETFEVKKFLNSWGDKGWELVSIIDIDNQIHCYFKKIKIILSIGIWL